MLHPSPRFSRQAPLLKSKTRQARLRWKWLSEGPNAVQVSERMVWVLASLGALQSCSVGQGAPSIWPRGARPSAAAVMACRPAAAFGLARRPTLFRWSYTFVAMQRNRRGISLHVALAAQLPTCTHPLVWDVAQVQAPRSRGAHSELNSSIAIHKLIYSARRSSDSSH